MFDIIGKRFWAYFLTLIVTIVAIVGLVAFPLKEGIEFSSGSILTLKFEQKVDLADLKTELSSLGYDRAIIQTTGGGAFLIRTSELSDTQRTQMEAALKDKFGALNEAEFAMVSPLVASETSTNAGIAVAVSAIGILLYVSWAFRKMPKPFHYGVSTIVALLHDVLLAMGFFAIFGKIFGWETNLMFITGLMTILGYSVNNAVVVFDRIRENLHKGVSSSFEVVVNNSMVETLSRCMNTTLTTIFTLLAIMLFVGASIQNFCVVFLFGLIAGTFSSVVIAPSLLVTWEKKEWGRFLKLPTSG